MISSLKKLINDNSEEELVKDFEDIINENCDQYFDDDNKLIKYYQSLHILSKKDDEFDINDVFKILKGNANLNNGEITCSKEGNIGNLEVHLECFTGATISNDSIVFSPEFRKKYENKYYQQKETFKNNVKPTARMPIKIKKQNDFLPERFFIYVVENKKIYDNFNFVKSFLSESSSKTFYYKGSIEYNSIRPLRINKVEIM